ncbi:hypothetical protein FRB90_007309 [Tulasnella sp. 427]|nr:hypothetical protein FRB90_007309 [Tulasnella sp. 427]
MKSKRSSFGGGSGESVLHPPVESGWVTILDLAPIMRERGGKTSPLSSEVKPTLIAEFLATSTAPSVIPSATPHPAAIQLLSFSPSGTALCVCDVYGHVAKVFQVRGSLRGVRDPGTWSSSAQEKEKGTISPGTPGRRPSSLGDRAAAMNARRRSSGASSLSTSSNQLQVKDVGDTVRHMYDLIRGTTHAKVEHVSWSDDARWIGVGTSRGTFHTYAINPYGGKPDELSHLDGRVRNPDSLQSWPVSVHPVIRFKETAKEKYPAPIFKFLPLSVSRSSSILSPSLDRPSRSHNVSSSSMGRSSSAPSDNKILGKTGWQDVMTFAPPNGLLTLRRCVVSPALNNHANDPAAAAAAARRGPGAASGVSMMMNLVGSAGATQEAILKASETLVASWDLKRDSSWDEVKSSIGGGASRRRQEPSTPSDALSKAELSTSSKSPHILPPSVYASHQFNFFALSEDWEAPLRQAHFDLPTRKIEVRKEVEILSGGQPIGSVGSSFKSALRYDDGEAFIQEFDAGQGTTTSIERPIATAISTNIDAQAAEQVIPSFPNAYKPSSWRDSIVPVRTVAAGVAGGVGEGIGRIKREISKARAANKGQQTSSSERVNEAPSLAFDEDDESIFAQEDDPSAATTGHGGLQLPHSGDSATGSVPSTNGPETDHSRDDVSDAWSENQEEVDKVLAEAATFDEIAASGFMMEEEQERRRLKGELDDTAATPRGKGKARVKGKGKGKKA